MSYSYDGQNKLDILRVFKKTAANVEIRMKKRYEKISKITVNDVECCNYNSDYAVVSLPIEVQDAEILIYYEGERCRDEEGFCEQTRTQTAHENKFAEIPAATGDMKQKMISISSLFNDKVCDIYRHEYLSPRPETCSLQTPIHLIPSNWCWVHTHEVDEMNDDFLRENIKDGVLQLDNGLCFEQPAQGKNVAFVSRWDNFPDSVSVDVHTEGKQIYFLITGYTNQMQCEVVNGSIVLKYENGVTEEYELIAPINFRSMEKGPDTERM